MTADISDDEAKDLFLVDLMRTADTEIKIALESARLAHRHSGNVGDHVEAAMRSVIERFLPRSLYVGHGEIVDKVATRSHQADVVVANDLQPFRLASDAPGLYLVEGVSAVGEIKSRLTTAELDDCIRKGSRSKTLRFRAHAGSTASANPSDVNRFYYSPPFFVVAVESQVATQTLLDRLSAVDSVESQMASAQPSTRLMRSSLSREALRSTTATAKVLLGWSSTAQT